MKTTACNDFLEEILTAEKALSAMAEEHVKTCPECARLRADALRFAVTSMEPEVPEKLDRAILKHAAAVLRKRPRAHWLFRRLFPCGAAAAAAAVLCMVMLSPENEPAASGERVQLAAVSADSTWSAFEREAFDLNQELTSCQNVMAAWQTTME